MLNKKNNISSSNLSRKSFLSILNTVLNLVLGLVSVYFVSHYFGPIGMGSFSYALAFVATFSILLDLGTATSHVKRLSEGLDEARCIGTYLSIKLFLSLLYIVIVLFALYFIDSRDPNYFSDDIKIMIYILLISKILTSISLVMSQTFIARTETALAVVPSLIEKIINVFSKVFVCISGSGLIYIAFSNLFGSVILVLIFILLFKNREIKAPNIKYLKSYILFGLPLFIISFSDLVMSTMDKLLIGNFLGVYEVGLYSAPQTFIWPSTIIGISVSTLIMPLSSSYLSEGKLVPAKNLLIKAESYISLFFGPVIIFSIFMSDILVYYLLGEDFSTSAEYIKFFALTSLFFSLSQPFVSFLIASERLRVLALISVISILINLTLNMIFIPSSIMNINVLGLGAKGAIIATIISYLFTYLSLRYCCKIGSIKPLFTLCLKLLISISPALFLLETYSISKTNFEGILFSAFLIFFNTLFYFFVLFMINEFTKKEFYTIMLAIHPSKMLRYIRQEIND